MRFGPQNLTTTVQRVAQFDDQRPVLYSFWARNTGSSAQTVTLTFYGSDTVSVPVPAGLAVLLRNLSLAGVAVDGGTVLAYIAPEPEYMDPGAFNFPPTSQPVTVSGTVTTDIGSTNSYAKTPVPYAGGAPAPRSGLWEIAWTAGTGATTISINGTVIEPPAAVVAGKVQVFTYPVQGSSTYVVSDNGSPAGTLTDGVLL